MNFPETMHKLWADNDFLRYPDSYFYKGYCIFNGLTFKKNDKEANKQFDEGIKRKNTKCLYAKGFFNADYAACARAFPELFEEADRDIFAKYYLGLCYRFGHGVMKNPEKCQSIMMELVKLDFIPAIDIVGNNYLTGTGVEENFDKAIEYLTIAADALYPKALNTFGYLYGTGTGFEKDFHKSFEYYRKAAEFELPSALFALGVMYLNAEGTPFNEKEGIKLVKKAAGFGYKDALKFMGKKC